MLKVFFPLSRFREDIWEINCRFLFWYSFVFRYHIIVEQSKNISMLFHPTETFLNLESINCICVMLMTLPVPLALSHMLSVIYICQVHKQLLYATCKRPLVHATCHWSHWNFNFMHLILCENLEFDMFPIVCVAWHIFFNN